MIWPRSAILQSDAASSVAGMSGFTVSTAARMASFGVASPSARARSIAFWQMSRLVRRSGLMLIAASVRIMGRGYVGTASRKQWLSRLQVRSPASGRSTARSSSSVCRLPFIRLSASPRRTKFDRERPGMLAVLRREDAIRNFNAGSVGYRGSSLPDPPESAR